MLTRAVGLAVVTTKPLVKPKMIRELFIILVREKGSQGRESPFSGEPRGRACPWRLSPEELGVVFAKHGLEGGGGSFRHGVDFLNQAKNVRGHDEQISNSAWTRIPISVW